MTEFEIYSTHDNINTTITVNGEELYKLFGIKLGTIVRSKMQGYGIVLGLKVNNVTNISPKLVIQYQDENKATWYSSCKTWQDHIDQGLEIVDDNIGTDQFLYYLNNCKYSDILLYVGLEEKQFYGHLIILSTYPWFEKLFDSNMIEMQNGKIYLPDINPLCFEVVLEYIYTGRIVLEKHENINFLELHSVANKLMIDKLKLYCRELLKTNICLDNCVNILEFSVQEQDQNLEEYCV